MAYHRSRSLGVGAKIIRRRKSLTSICHCSKDRSISLTLIIYPPPQLLHSLAQFLHKFIPFFCVFHLGFGLAGTQEVVRLGLRSLDQEFFYQNVQATGGIVTFLDNVPLRETDSQQRIFENVKYLYEKLTELDPDERAQLAGFIIGQCYLVVVSTSNMTSAYRIFSVMNDRGLDLSATDILKAEIIGDLSDAEEQRSYADKWEDIEQELGRDRFGALFTHLRTIYAKPQSTERMSVAAC